MPGTGSVSVVVIGYNDAQNVTAAAASALAQGPDVGEVIVVDDCSTDGTVAALAPLESDPRLRVISRRVNSGGCGTPRNDGIAAARHDYVMFLDSDDILPAGAVTALLPLAVRHGADVVAGKAVRRELPGTRTSVWAPRLYDTSAGATLPGAVLEGIGDHSELLWDTLSVNKLYRRDFLRDHAVAFPDGAVTYEDFVFTARLYAAAPRLVITDAPVYIWHVRRAAAQLSISLRRARLRNWEDRITAHRAVVDVFRAAGQQGLAKAAQAKFLDYDLPMYLRELPQRDLDYRRGWWLAARAYIADFEAGAVERAATVSRWIAGVLDALPESPGPGDIGRLVELAATPPRLVPPYSGDAGNPLFGTGAAAVPLKGLETLRPAEIPAAVDGTVTPGSTVRLDLRIHDLYGRLAELVPDSVRVTLVEGSGRRPVRSGRAGLRQDGGSWTATVTVPAGEFEPADTPGRWTIRAEIVYADGSATSAEVRAGTIGRQRPILVLPRPGRPTLMWTDATARHALMLHTASGFHGVRRVIRAAGRKLSRR